MVDGGGTFERIAPQQVGTGSPMSGQLDHFNPPGYYAARLCGPFFIYRKPAGELGPQRRISQAPLAQLDRASDYGSEGSKFESWWVHQPLISIDGGPCVPAVVIFDR